MSQNVIERKLAEVSHADGDAEIELPDSHYYERLAILVDYEITTGSSASKNRSGVLELLDKIEVEINGNQTVKKVDLEMSHLIDQYQYGTRPVFDPLDYSTASTQTGQVATFVDFTITPEDVSAMLPSFETSDFTLSLEWGSSSDVGSDVTIDSATATVTSRERLRQSVASSRNKEQRLLSNLMVFKERQKRQRITASGETEIDLPTGNTYYAIPFRVYDADTPDDDLVQSFEVVEDGVDTHRAITYDAARAKDVTEYGFDRADLPTGFVYTNFGLQGDLDDVVPTAGLNQWKLVPDTDGTAPTSPAEIELVTQELIEP